VAEIRDVAGFDVMTAFHAILPGGRSSIYAYYAHIAFTAVTISTSAMTQNYKARNH
jgi:hypothetical protein